VDVTCREQSRRIVSVRKAQIAKEALSSKNKGGDPASQKGGRLDIERTVYLSAALEEGSRNGVGSNKSSQTKNRKYQKKARLLRETKVRELGGGKKTTGRRPTRNMLPRGFDDQGGSLQYIRIQDKLSSRKGRWGGESKRKFVCRTVKGVSKKRKGFNARTIAHKEKTP